MRIGQFRNEVAAAAKKPGCKNPEKLNNLVKELDKLIAAKGNFDFDPGDMIKSLGL